MTGDKHTGHSHDERLARDAARLLRQGARELDAATLSRLNRARHAAVAATRRMTWSRRLFAPAAVAAALALVVAGLLRTGPAPEGLPLAADADLELLLEGETLEMLEDFELLTWMDAERSADELLDEIGSAG